MARSVSKATMGSLLLLQGWRRTRADASELIESLVEHSRVAEPVGEKVAQRRQVWVVLGDLVQSAVHVREQALAPGRGGVGSLPWRLMCTATA